MATYGYRGAPELAQGWAATGNEDMAPIGRLGARGVLQGGFNSASRALVCVAGALRWLHVLANKWEVNMVVVLSQGQAVVLDIDAQRQIHVLEVDGGTHIFQCRLAD